MFNLSQKTAIWKAIKAFFEIEKHLLSDIRQTKIMIQTSFQREFSSVAMYNTKTLANTAPQKYLSIKPTLGCTAPFKAYRKWVPKDCSTWSQVTFQKVSSLSPHIYSFSGRVSVISSFYFFY